MADEPLVDAATRKLHRLMAAAAGAQHNSIASNELVNFNRELTENYAAANAQAEAEELAAIPATDETEDEVDAEEAAAEAAEDANDDSSRMPRNRRPRRR